jgi:rhamnogalacturonyl hydrolase YesR
MPLHDEMSDSVFMGTPILAAAGKLTGDPKYFDMAVRHFRFMQKLDLRADGLYRHSPLDEAAWGRGNAFPAMGLAFTLEYLPKNDEVLTAYQHLMETLARFQDVDGMWHEVIDVPGSYAELTATSMIAVAMQKGIRNGWIPAEKYKPIVERAWTAVKGRVAPDGQLIDVCTSTGKQKNLKAYLDRTAILGLDPRGGAMALLLATELIQ